MLYYVILTLALWGCAKRRTSSRKGLRPGPAGFGGVRLLPPYFAGAGLRRNLRSSHLLHPPPPSVPLFWYTLVHSTGVLEQ